MQFNWIAIASTVVVTAAVTLGQDTPFDREYRWAWSSSSGWLNWRGFGLDTTKRPRYNSTRMAGYIWSINTGWLDLGDGAPGPAGMDRRYRNEAGDDAGVNIEPGGDLSGFAWSPNIGWVNFDTRAALGDQGLQARIDFVERRLRGYAWSSNLGWINLDDDDVFVGLGCLADLDGDGTLTIFDFLAFQNLFDAMDPAADFDSDGAFTIFDFLAFQNAFDAGCE